MPGDWSFKVAYTTDPDKIEPAVDAGTIDGGDLVIVNKDGKGSLRFINQNGTVLEFPPDLTESTVQEIRDKVNEIDVIDVI